VHPWVLDNARLRSAGWAPTRTSAEAFAEAGRQLPAAVRVGRVQVRRDQVRRGVAAGAGLALLAVVAVARRQARTRRRGAGRRPSGPT
jgi:hypothetical protein